MATESGAALAEMYWQVGSLQLDGRGVAVKGVLMGQLVMPDDLARGHAVVEVVARAAPTATVNIMGQDRPPIGRRLPDFLQFRP